MLKRRMIRLPEKLIMQRDDIHREHGSLLKYTRDYRKRFSIIRKVLAQEDGNPVDFLWDTYGKCRTDD